MKAHRITPSLHSLELFLSTPKVLNWPKLKILVRKTLDVHEKN